MLLPTLNFCFFLEISSTTPFCETRVCSVLGIDRCIPMVDICDGERFCDDGTDEEGVLFPNVPRCNPTTSNQFSPSFVGFYIHSF